MAIVEKRIVEARNTRKLDLRSLLIREVPSSAFLLSDITELHLSTNWLNVVPMIGSLTSLTILTMCPKEPLSLPSDDEFSWNGRLSSLPLTIGCMRELTCLNLNSNRLRSLPYTKKAGDPPSQIWLAVISSVSHPPSH